MERHLNEAVVDLRTRLQAQLDITNARIGKLQDKEPDGVGEIIVDVADDGELRMNGKAMTDADFTKALQDIAKWFPNQSVKIRAEKQTKYAEIVRVIVLCKNEGIGNISFTTATSGTEPIEKSLAEVVYVGGQVRNPGSSKWQKGMTLHQAVLAVGGVTEFGSLKRVRLNRNGKIQTYDLTDPKSVAVTMEPDDTLGVLQKNALGE